MLRGRCHRTGGPPSLGPRQPQGAAPSLNPHAHAGSTNLLSSSSARRMGNCLPHSFGPPHPDQGARVREVQEVQAPQGASRAQRGQGRGLGGVPCQQVQTSAEALVRGSKAEVPPLGRATPRGLEATSQRDGAAGLGGWCRKKAASGSKSPGSEACFPTRVSAVVWGWGAGTPAMRTRAQRGHSGSGQKRGASEAWGRLGVSVPDPSQVPGGKTSCPPAPQRDRPPEAAAVSCDPRPARLGGRLPPCSPFLTKNSN